LIEHIKILKADEIVPNFIYMMENSETFGAYQDENFKKPFTEFTKTATQKIFDA